MNVDTIGKNPHRAPVHGTGRSAGTLPSRLLAGLVLSAVLVAATSWFGTSPAAAHGDTGEITVTRAEQTGPNQVELEVGIVHSDDAHLASEATVSATLAGPAGDTIGPIELTQVEPESSLYAAQVDVSGPGSWAVTVESTNPTGSAQAEIDVVQSDETTTTETPSTTTTVEATADGTNSVTATPLDATAEDSSSDSRWLLIGAAVAAVALVAIVTLALRRNAGDAHDDDALT